MYLQVNPVSNIATALNLAPISPNTSSSDFFFFPFRLWDSLLGKRDPGFDNVKLQLLLPSKWNLGISGSGCKTCHGSLGCPLHIGFGPSRMRHSRFTAKSTAVFAFYAGAFSPAGHIQRKTWTQSSPLVMMCHKEFNMYCSTKDCFFRSVPCLHISSLEAVIITSDSALVTGPGSKLLAG